MKKKERERKGEGKREKERGKKREIFGVRIETFLVCNLKRKFNKSMQE